MLETLTPHHQFTTKHVHLNATNPLSLGKLLTTAIEVIFWCSFTLHRQARQVYNCKVSHSVCGHLLLTENHEPLSLNGETDICEVVHLATSSSQHLAARRVWHTSVRA